MSLATQSVEDGIPTQSVGSSEKSKAVIPPQNLQIDNRHVFPKTGGYL
jgi:hypothetical protein